LNLIQIIVLLVKDVNQNLENVGVVKMNLDPFQRDCDTKYCSMIKGCQLKYGKYK